LSRLRLHAVATDGRTVAMNRARHHRAGEVFPPAARIGIAVLMRY